VLLNNTGGLYRGGYADVQPGGGSYTGSVTVTIIVRHRAAPRSTTPPTGDAQTSSAVYSTALTFAQTDHAERHKAAASGMTNSAVPVPPTPSAAGGHATFKPGGGLPPDR